MKLSIFTLALIVGLATQRPAWSATIYPVNNGFEVPNLGSGPGAEGYGTPIGNPLPSVAGIGWTFVGASGITANGAFDQSGDTNGNSDGTKSTSGQAAFIQYAPGSFPGLTLSSISQALTFQAGTTSVTFSIQRRDVFGNNPIDVKIDGQDLGTYLATNLTGFNTITTPSVTVTGGTHTLYFIGTNPTGTGSSNGDVTQFIDNVSLTNDPAAVPEPSSIVLLGSGLAGILVPFEVRKFRILPPLPLYSGGEGRGEGGQHPSVGYSISRGILTPPHPQLLSPRVQGEKGVDNGRETCELHAALAYAGRRRKPVVAG